MRTSWPEELAVVLRVSGTVHGSFVAFGMPFTVNAAWCEPGWNTVVWPRSIGGGEK